MSVLENAGSIQSIPLRQLFLSPLNVRNTRAAAGLEELAALLTAECVLQKFAVIEEMLTDRRG